MWKWAKETRGEYFAHLYIIPHIQTLKKILSWIYHIKISLHANKSICIFHDCWRYFVIILIFAKYVSFCIKIHRLNNLLNDTNDHFKCRREHIKQLLFFVPLCSIFIHSYIKFFFLFCPYNFFIVSQSVTISNKSFKLVRWLRINIK